MRTVGILVAMMCLGASARAETILITSGSMVWTGFNSATPVTLSGAGFFFQGLGLSGLEVDALTLPVLPATVTLPTTWVGSDLPGVATVNGVTYTNVGSLLGNTSLAASWTTTFTVPTGFSTGTFTLPFTFTGMFLTGAPGGVANLSGGGAATIELRRDGQLPGLFHVDAARYEFESAAAVPEPMSIVLVGTGLAALAVRRRRR